MEYQGYTQLLSINALMHFNAIFVDSVFMESKSAYHRQGVLECPSPLVRYACM